MGARFGVIATIVFHSTVANAGETTNANVAAKYFEEVTGGSRSNSNPQCSPILGEYRSPPETPVLTAEKLFDDEIWKIPNLPSISIYGETHDKNAERERADLIKRASRGEFILILEGKVYDAGGVDQSLLEPHQDGALLGGAAGASTNGSASPKVYGMEDSFVWDFVSGPRDLFDFARFQEEAEREAENAGEQAKPSARRILGLLKEGMLQKLAESQNLQEAWAMADKEFLNPKMVEMIDEIILESKRGNWAKVLLKYQDTPIYRLADRQFMAAYREIGIAMGKMAEKKYSGAESLPKMDQYYKWLKEPQNEVAGNSVVDEITIKWRNQFLARNIARVYKKAALEGKEVRVVVGKLHQADLVSMLKEAGGKRLVVQGK